MPSVPRRRCGRGPRQHLLDVGAGPGTASWAGLAAWPSLARATLIDGNPHLLALARKLHASAPQIDLSVVPGDAAGALDDDLAADVVMASYALTEIVGTSTKSIEDAIQQAIATASQTLKNLAWFEVTQTRGHIENGRVAHYQVYLRLGFRYEEKPVEA